MNNPREIRSIKRITDVSLMPDGTFDIGFIIDETPIECTSNLWLKDNPYIKKKEADHDG